MAYVLCPDGFPKALHYSVPPNPQDSLLPIASIPLGGSRHFWDGLRVNGDPVHSQDQLGFTNDASRANVLHLPARYDCGLCPCHPHCQDYLSVGFQG